MHFLTTWKSSLLVIGEISRSDAVLLHWCGNCVCLSLARGAATGCCVAVVVHHVEFVCVFQTRHEQQQERCVAAVVPHVDIVFVCHSREEQQQERCCVSIIIHHAEIVFVLL
jgi:hypothetical protein